MRSPRFTWWHLALALGLCAPACNFHCSSSKVTRQAPQSDARVAATDVQVQNAGQPPRIMLQLGRWTGLSYSQTLTVDTSFGLAGKPVVHAPTALTTLRYTVLRGSADPIVRHTDAGKQALVAERGVVESASVKSTTLPAATLKALNHAYAKLVGTTMRRLVAEDGHVVEVKTELVGGMQATPQIKKFVDAAWQPERTFPFRLPSIPVGRGARWSFSEPIQLPGGVHAVQVAYLSLLSIDGHHATIRIRVRQSAPRQLVPNPLNPQTLATLDSYRGDGEGEVTLDRLTAVPVAARLATTASLTLSAQGPKGKRVSATLASGSVLSERGQILGTGTTDGGAPAAKTASPATSATPGALHAPSSP